ncbi:hypothetical protein GCM10010145_02290 [Streptomyces ruber]|uniref:Uncharacterized protein n=2 Tax=Streptomyces TaxID=1883 RepID=A0A918EN46_9ACTN|nr:hypothetical protein GCM10010145_02290 [Streptomyces ruber]
MPVAVPVPVAGFRPSSSHMCCSQRVGCHGVVRVERVERVERMERVERYDSGIEP